MKFRDLYKIYKSKNLLTSLQDWGLIPKEIKCRNCEQPMELYNNAESADGHEYKCVNYISRNIRKRAICGTQLSFRTGTFLEGSTLSIWQIVQFVFSWVRNSKLEMIGNVIENSSSHLLVNWASYCRDILQQTLYKNPIKIGGPEKTVEIDEIQFGTIKTCRVIGGIERGSGRMFLAYVDNRDKDTLIAIVKTWIEDGTTIFIDCCKSYDCFDSDELRQLEVNHSIKIKDSENGRQTKAMRSSLRPVEKFLNSYGRREAHIPGKLARYMFGKRCDKLKLDRTKEFFRLAGQLYNPNDPQENAGNRNPDLFNTEFDDEDLLDEYYIISSKISSSNKLK